MLYAAALLTPAFEGFSGVLCLVVGPITCVMLPMWLANPLLWFGCYKLTNRQYSWSFGSGVLAALLSASFAGWSGMLTLQPGYWLWLSAMSALVAAADDHRCRGRKPVRSTVEPEV